MNEGFEAAREGRNWLERLGEKVPGFRGFQDRELRRDVDRMQREHLARELGRLKQAVRGKARVYTDAGKIGSLHLFDRLDRQLDGLAQAIRFADYGQSGFFDVVKFGEEELERLYRFDLSIVDDLAGLGGEVAAVPLPGEGDPNAALGTLAERLGTLQEKWSRREGVVGEVVREAGGA